MPQNRRTFLKGASAATIAASAAPLAIALPQGPGEGATPAVAASRSFVGGLFALELDGKFAGYLPAVQGGHPVAEVVEFADGSEPNLRRKQVGKVKFEDIKLTQGAGMSRAFWQWVEDMVKGAARHADGKIHYATFDRRIVHTLDFRDALLTEIGIPACDAASREEPGLMTFTVRPGFTEATPGGGLLPDEPLARQKMWSPANFRIKIGNLPCSRVSKVDAFSIKQQIIEYQGGGDRVRQIEPGKLEYPNLAVTFSALDRAPWQAFFDDFVIAGNNGDVKELDGELELLAPDLKTVLTRLEFSNMGIFRFAPEEVEPASTNISQFRADLYVEGTRLFVGGLN